MIVIGYSGILQFSVFFIHPEHQSRTIRSRVVVIPYVFLCTSEEEEEIALAKTKVEGYMITYEQCLSEGRLIGKQILQSSYASPS